MNVDGHPYRTVWAEDTTVHMIAQDRLPFAFEVRQLPTCRATCEAISTMVVRGAGAIGATAAYAMAQGIGEGRSEAARAAARAEIEATRPTAQNLFAGVAAVWDAARFASDPPAAAWRAAQAFADADADACAAIGRHGAELIGPGAVVATHCNAGWLAFVDHGSALAPVYAAQAAGRQPHVIVHETRPRGQGARLTAWELGAAGVPHTLVADNACAHLMAHGEIDLMIVGADRIVMNGDVANKIGTLSKALAARHFGVPFYVAAPTATIDAATIDGRDIPIEERSPDEVLWQEGPTADGTLTRVRVVAPGTAARNPAFDVTPAELIAGIITERGIVPASRAGLQSLF